MEGQDWLNQNPLAQSENFLSSNSFRREQNDLMTLPGQVLDQTHQMLGGSASNAVRKNRVNGKADNFHGTAYSK